MRGRSKSDENSSRNRCSRAGGGTLGPSTWIAWTPSRLIKETGSDCWATARGGPATATAATTSAKSPNQRRVIVALTIRKSPASLAGGRAHRRRRRRRQHLVAHRRCVARRQRGDRFAQHRRGRCARPQHRRRVGHVLLLVADLRCPALTRQRADRRVVIERGALDLGKALDITRALVDAGGRAAHDARPEPVMLAGDDIAGIAKTGGYLADHVARVRRARDR